MGRILGIDFGKKYVGVAISDPLLITAQSLITIKRDKPSKLRQTLAKLAEICDENDVEMVVVGLPLNMDGSENERCKFTYEFADLLFNRVLIPIYLWDERLTTVSSDKELCVMGIKNKKDYSDEMAAMMILEGFMEAKKNDTLKDAFRR